MPIKKAVSSFREERLNCAQSIFRAFHASEEQLRSAVLLGRGRADGGRCGALHAALELAVPGERESLRRSFAAVAGSERCAEIRRGGMLTCAQCVELAAELLVKIGDKNGE